MLLPRYMVVVADIDEAWRDGDRNALRPRMTGRAPHVTLWINGVKMWELQMPGNDQIAGQYGGMIGPQLHWTAAYSETAAFCCVARSISVTAAFTPLRLVA